MAQINPSKYAFVGSGCVGKTTLLQHFQAKLAQRRDVVFVEEAARDYLALHNVESRFGAEAQGRIQGLALSRERSALEGGPRMILCDRSVLDAVVYTRALGDLRGAKTLYDRIAAWIPTYSEIFLLDPKGVPYVDDDVRTEGDDLRMRFHRTFLEVMSEEEVAFRLLSGALSERISAVEDALASDLLEPN
jgi:nicotinamide riboside kinase